MQQPLPVTIAITPQLQQAVRRLHATDRDTGNLSMTFEGYLVYLVVLGLHAERMNRHRTEEA